MKSYPENFFHSEGGQEGVDSNKLLLSPWIMRKNEQKSLQCFFGGQEEGRKIQGFPEEQEVHLLMEKLQIEAVKPYLFQCL